LIANSSLEGAMDGTGDAFAQADRKGKNMTLIILILLIVILAGGGGYWGNSRWGYGGGAGVSLGTVLLIVLLAYLLGFI
jgi:hypothetical protein